MIYDHISQWERYKGVGPDIAEGLQFLADASDDIAEGRHELADGSYANVERYTTKVSNPNGFEAHRKYTDIQYLVSGCERVRVRQKRDLDCAQPYDEARDAAFYHDDGGKATEALLGNGMFAIFFPQDAHEPQLAAEGACEVKKIVVKIKNNA